MWTESAGERRSPLEGEMEGGHSGGLLGAEGLEAGTLSWGLPESLSWTRMSPRRQRWPGDGIPASQSPYSSTISSCQQQSWADGEERGGGGTGGSLLFAHWCPAPGHMDEDSSHRTMLTTCQQATLWQVRA